MTEPVLPDLAPDPVTSPADDEAERAREITERPAVEADPADVVEQVRDATPPEDPADPAGAVGERGLEVDEADAWDGAAEVGADDDEHR